MRKALIFFIALFFATGCEDTHRLVRNNINLSNTLSAGDSFYVAVTRDSTYGTTTYQGSGQMTTQVMYSAFAGNAKQVQAGQTFHTFEENLQTARNYKFKYLVYTSILVWHDRATKWSGFPDQIEIKIEVIHAETGLIVESGTIKSKGGLSTFGSDRPQDLLPKAINSYVSKLFPET